MYVMLLAFAVMAAAGVAETITLPLYSRGCKPSGVDVPVTDWFSRTDNQWFTTISVGTPPQDLAALFDTGSSLLFLPRNNCTTCPNLTLFNPNKSSTFSALPGTQANFTGATGADSVPLPQPEKLTCRSVHDTVSLSWGKLKVDGQHFALCDTYAGTPDKADKSPISGILGMGIRDPSVKDTPWYWNLVEDGQLESPLFSLYIPPHNLAGGQVTLGGVDESKVEGNIAWTSLSVAATRELRSYVIDQPAIYADGKLLYGETSGGSPASVLSSHAILDTATAFIQTPNHAVAKAIYAEISPNITQIDRAGAWGTPCKLMASIAPDLTFSLGTGAEALNLTIPKRYFNLGEYPGQPGICQALFNSPTEDSSILYNDTGVWIAGSPLLNKYYTVWDGVGLHIGWGKLPGLPGLDGRHNLT